MVALLYPFATSNGEGIIKLKKNVRCIRYAPVISLYVCQVFPVVYKEEFVCISDNYTFTKSALHTKTIPVREH